MKQLLLKQLSDFYVGWMRGYYGTLVCNMQARDGPRDAYMVANEGVNREEEKYTLLVFVTLYTHLPNDVAPLQNFFL